MRAVTTFGVRVRLCSRPGVTSRRACWYAWKQTAARMACFMTTFGARPAARMAPGVNWTPSTNSATGASRKKEMMVMQENRLMLSSVPCAAASAPSGSTERCSVHGRRLSSAHRVPARIVSSHQC